LTLCVCPLGIPADLAEAVSAGPRCHQHDLSDQLGDPSLQGAGPWRPSLRSQLVILLYLRRYGPCGKLTHPARSGRSA
jgi:hypothetical protein